MHLSKLIELYNTEVNTKVNYTPKLIINVSIITILVLDLNNWGCCI